MVIRNTLSHYPTIQLLLYNKIGESLIDVHFNWLDCYSFDISLFMIEQFWISIEKFGQTIEKFDRTIEKFDQTPLKNLTIYKKYCSRSGNLTLSDVGLIPDLGQPLRLTICGTLPYKSCFPGALLRVLEIFSIIFTLPTSHMIF